MTEDLLVHYNRELAYFRKLSTEFARAFPDVASQLRADATTGQDPYVERMIEAFAYLSARVRKKLDDDFPEIAESMLQVLYPHYLAPVPSMAIVQLELEPGQAALVDGYAVKRGARIETEPVDGEPCQFRTAYPLHLLPLKVSQAALVAGKLAPRVPWAPNPVAALQIRIQSFKPEFPLSKFNLNSLRFYLAANSIHANALYELLFRHSAGAALNFNERQPKPLRLEPECLKPIGFERHEELLPYPPRSFRGYGLLTEYFSLPEKLRFFELGPLNAGLFAGAGATADIWIYLQHTHEDLEANVRADTFRLGCTPIVNLFEQRADPIKLTQMRSQYHVVPDARRTSSLEIYSINEVIGVARDGAQKPFYPFYSTTHTVSRAEQRAYWYASRRAAGYRDGKRDPATEIDLTLVDLDFSPAELQDWTLDIRLTCLNRDLPARLEFGPDRPRMRLADGGPLAPLRCLTPPTPTRRPSMKHGVLWRLISHLSLNHLSLVEDGKGAAALREMLGLYDFLGTPELTSRLESLVEVTSRRDTAWINQAEWCGFCRGIEVTLKADEQRFADNGLFLFASVIERFLGLYCSVNSFSRLALQSARREGDVHRWPPRAADLQLL